jgi:hypothetical protein
MGQAISQVRGLWNRFHIANIANIANIETRVKCGQTTPMNFNVGNLGNLGNVGNVS